MEIRVLGELEVVEDGGTVTVPALKLRQLLAALAIAVGKECSADELIDALWGENPPSSSAKLLHVYVSKLRKLVRCAAAIRTRGSGYALDLGEITLDCGRFERLVSEGKEALHEGNPELATSRLRRGLELWRGAAYGQLRYADSVRAEAERLEELRLDALATRIEAELAAGRHGQILGEARSLARSHPIDERLQGLAMLCLYRCGRQSEALELFTSLRTRLREELGLAPGTALRELQMRILRQERVLDSRDIGPPQTALPHPPSRLFGRERELRELQALLGRDDLRMLVLTGAGGSGKTRLAIETARRCAGSFTDGVAFAPMAAVRESELVGSALLRCLGLEGQGGNPAKDVADALAPRELLLVVDNVEHLSSAAVLFPGLLSRAPRLKLLITSRAVLHVSGEHVYPVGPLDPEACRELFLERALAAAPDAALERADDDLIEQICERVDQLPLAIELAASRTRMLTLAELLAKLEPRLALLSGGPRDLPARQQTMHATIAWSYDLLDEARQRDFRRLAIFNGGFTPPAAEAVCGSTFERLSEFVDHNLLQRTEVRGISRFQMLETVREFATEQLHLAGEHEQLGRLHGEFFLALAEAANLYAEAEETQDFDTVNAEENNLRAGITAARERGDVELALRLAVALENFWVTHDPVEGIELLGGLLDSDNNIAPVLRGRTLRAVAGCTHALGEFERAQCLYEQSRDLFEALDDEQGIAILDYRLGQVAVELGHLARAHALLEASLERFDKTGSRRGIAQAIGDLGSVALREGDRELAATRFEQSAEMCGAIGRKWWQARMLKNLADLALDNGRDEEAAARSTELLRLADQIGDRKHMVGALACLSCSLSRQGQLYRAGRLWGALDMLEARTVEGAWPRERQPYASEILTHSALTEFQSGLHDGGCLGLRDAIDEVLAHPP